MVEEDLYAKEVQLTLCAHQMDTESINGIMYKYIPLYTNDSHVTTGAEKRPQFELLATQSLSNSC
jgi:hypothetical protein